MMKRIRLRKTIYSLGAMLLLLGFCSCKDSTLNELKIGDWRGTMQVSNTEELPFNFELSKTEDGTLLMTLKNADERVKVNEIILDKDSIIIKMPVFEGYIAGTYSETEIQGAFIKESLDRVVPFHASFGNSTRFEINTAPKVDLSGIWKVDFEYDTEDAYPAKGIFYQDEGIVTGTFRTTTGDYRYLEGVVDGSTLKLSTFDGAHVFLFTAKANDSTLEGVFYSGNHSVEKFRAVRDSTFELPSANDLTFIKEGYDRFDFSFPNESGQLVGLQDSIFRNKVVLVQVMGTWCPNCLDETKFYMEYLKNNPNTDVQIVGLAFEYAKTEAKAFEGIRRLKDRIGVTYPILLAQIGTSNKTKANEKLPMLNHVLSYPTTIYLDKKGDVHKIHTGFNGPATGDTYVAFKKEFDATIKKLLAE